MKRYILILSLICGAFVVRGQIISNSDFVNVAAGNFSMGNSSYSRESPVRTVNVSTFNIDRYTVTNAQFAQFLNIYGSQTVLTGEYTGKILFVPDSWGIINNNGTWTAASGYEQFPAVKVTWYGANEFCKYIGGRLPTEAEWEYAAKGGSSQQSYTYSGSSTATSVAWYYDNSGHLNKTVGTKTANSLGLYDMSGNVNQWCADWFGRYGDFGATGDLNPQGPQNGISRVIRGGYRSIGSDDLHLTNRESLSPDESYNFVGFRVVKDVLTTEVSPKNESINIFPNPAGNNLTISSAYQIDKVEIVDCDGKSFYNSPVPNNSISLKNYSDGLYLVKVNSGGNEIIRKIIIKH
jgi:formylglycine-generating enzyme required for sulfatase activity